MEEIVQICPCFAVREGKLIQVVGCHPNLCEMYKPLACPNENKNLARLKVRDVNFREW